MPKNDTRCDAYIQAVFRPILRYLETTVAHIHNLLLDTLHLVPKHNSIFSLRVATEILQHRTAFTLLYSKYRVSLALEPNDGILRLLEVTPRHTILCPKSSLVYFGMRRLCCNATETDSAQTERVARTKYASHIIKTTHVIEHSNNGLFLSFLVFCHTHAPHLGYFQFPHIVSFNR